MAGERTLPGIGLTGFWDLGDNGWKPGMDVNLRRLSALVQLSVLSRVTALPASPADGAIYIVPTGAPSNANEIAIRDSGAWVYVAPAEGWLGYVKDEDLYVKFNGTAWEVLATGGGGSSAPTGRAHVGTADTFVIGDANNVVTSDNAAAVTQTIPPGVFPLWTTLTVVQRGAGAVTLAAGAGVTVNPAPGATLVSAGQYATMAAIQVAADVWVASGAFGAA